MAAPNIVNVTTIYGKTALQAVTTTATAIVSNSAGSGKVLKVNALYASNVDTGANNTVTVDVFRSSTAYRLGAAIVVPIAATLDVLSNSIYLEEGDSLRLTANANSKIEAVCSYEEIN
jgi:hypothetical protein